MGCFRSVGMFLLTIYEQILFLTLLKSTALPAPDRAPLHSSTSASAAANPLLDSIEGAAFTKEILPYLKGRSRSLSMSNGMSIPFLGKLENYFFEDKSFRCQNLQRSA